MKETEAVTIHLSGRQYPVFVPDNMPAEEALRRTTHLGIGAHHDDLEIMAYHGILDCFGQDHKWFSGVILTDGSGSPRGGPYANCSAAEINALRIREQEEAAVLGNYSAVVFLNCQSSQIKNPADIAPRLALEEIISIARPRIIYTHNPADRHDTHVASVLRVMEALRNLVPALRPEKVYGCEVWRGLDWLPDEDKIIFDVSGKPSLAASLVKAHKSQIGGGKRYDLATAGRRAANATYANSHKTDRLTAAIYAMDLTPLLTDNTLLINEYVGNIIGKFADDVKKRMQTMIIPD